MGQFALLWDVFPWNNKLNLSSGCSPYLIFCYWIVVLVVKEHLTVLLGAPSRWEPHLEFYSCFPIAQIRAGRSKIVGSKTLVAGRLPDKTGKKPESAVIWEWLTLTEEEKGRKPWGAGDPNILVYFINICVYNTLAGLVGFCLASLISPQRRFSPQVFFKAGKCSPDFPHLRAHCAKLWAQNLCFVLETLANIIVCRLWPSLIIPSSKAPPLIKGSAVTFVFTVSFKGAMWG